MNKQFIVDNLGYRIGIYNPGCDIQIGRGDANADILVIQPTSKMPDRDAITGALNKFKLLNTAYRATSNILDKADAETNRKYLKELIQIIKPLMIVTCGEETTALLKGNKVKHFSRCSGKKFRVKDLPDYTFYCTINPNDYGFARAPQRLKDKGRTQWDEIQKIFLQLKEKQEQLRWI